MASPTRSAAPGKGAGHVYIKPRTPRLNGKVERSHRIDAEEFYRLLEGVVIDDAQVFNDKLREWEDFHNYHRPRGSLNGQTPMKDSSNEPRPERNPSPSLAHHDRDVWNRRLAAQLVGEASGVPAGLVELLLHPVWCGLAIVTCTAVSGPHTPVPNFSDRRPLPTEL